jgi:hypothetical protein
MIPHDDTRGKLRWSGCTALTKAGKPCHAPAFSFTPGLDGPLLCAMHRATPAERSEYGRRGARVTNRHKLMTRLEEAQMPQEQRDVLLQVPSLDSAEKCLRYLERVAAEVHAGLLPPTVANTINGLVGSALRIAELQVHAQLAAMEAELRGDR